MSFLTAVAVTVTQVLPADAADWLTSSLALEKHPLPLFVERPEFLSIPETLGRVELLRREGDRFVVLIQDAHTHREAQEHIRAILHALAEKNFDAVLLEGGAGALDPSVLDYFADRKDNIALGERLVAEGELSGTELFLYEARERAKGFGLERPALYRRNKEAFEDLLTLRGPALAFLKKAALALEARLSQQPFAFKAFVRERERYLDGRLPLTEFFREVEREARRTLAMDLRQAEFQDRYPMLVRLAKLMAVEDALARLDGEALRRERVEVVRMLRRNKASRELIGAFERFTGERAKKRVASPPLRAGAVRWLFERAYDQTGRGDFTYARYPTLALFARAQVFQNELESSALSREVESLANRIIFGLARSHESRRLVVVLRDHRLLSKAFQLKLARHEYERVRQRRKALSPSRFLRRLARVDIQKFDPAFEKVLCFYEHALARDRVFAREILTHLTRGGRKRLAVVTGGFHREGILKALEAYGVAHAVVTPAIQTLDLEEKYIQALTQTGHRIFDTRHLATASRLMSSGVVADWMGLDRNLVRGRIKWAAGRIKPLGPRAERRVRSAAPRAAKAQSEWVTVTPKEVILEALGWLAEGAVLGLTASSIPALAQFIQARVLPALPKSVRREVSSLLKALPRATLRALLYLGDVAAAFASASGLSIVPVAVSAAVSRVMSLRRSPAASAGGTDRSKQADRERPYTLGGWLALVYRNTRLDRGETRPAQIENLTWLADRWARAEFLERPLTPAQRARTRKYLWGVLRHLRAVERDAELFAGLARGQRQLRGLLERLRDERAARLRELREVVLPLLQEEREGLEAQIKEERASIQDEGRMPQDSWHLSEWVGDLGRLDQALAEVQQEIDGLEAWGDSAFAPLTSERITAMEIEGRLKEIARSFGPLSEDDYGRLLYARVGVLHTLESLYGRQYPFFSRRFPFVSAERLLEHPWVSLRAMALEARLWMRDVSSRFQQPGGPTHRRASAVAQKAVTLTRVKIYIALSIPILILIGGMLPFWWLPLIDILIPEVAAGGGIVAHFALWRFLAITASLFALSWIIGERVTEWANRLEHPVLTARDLIKMRHDFQATALRVLSQLENRLSFDRRFQKVARELIRASAQTEGSEWTEFHYLAYRVLDLVKALKGAPSLAEDPALEKAGSEAKSFIKELESTVKKFSGQRDVLSNRHHDEDRLAPNFLEHYGTREITDRLAQLFDVDTFRSASDSERRLHALHAAVRLYDFFHRRQFTWQTGLPEVSDNVWADFEGLLAELSSQASPGVLRKARRRAPAAAQKEGLAKPARAWFRRLAQRPLFVLGVIFLSSLTFLGASFWQPIVGFRNVPTKLRAVPLPDAGFSEIKLEEKVFNLDVIGEVRTVSVIGKLQKGRTEGRFNLELEGGRSFLDSVLYGPDIFFANVDVREDVSKVRIGGKTPSERVYDSPSQTVNYMWDASVETPTRPWGGKRVPVEIYVNPGSPAAAGSETTYLTLTNPAFVTWAPEHWRHAVFGAVVGVFVTSPWWIAPVLGWGAFALRGGRSSRRAPVAAYQVQGPLRKAEQVVTGDTTRSASPAARAPERESTMGPLVFTVGLFAVATVLVPRLFSLALATAPIWLPIVVGAVIVRLIVRRTRRQKPVVSPRLRTVDDAEPALPAEVGAPVSSPYAVSLGTIAARLLNGNGTLGNGLAAPRGPAFNVRVRAMRNGVRPPQMPFRARNRPAHQRQKRFTPAKATGSRRDFFKWSLAALAGAVAGSMLLVERVPERPPEAGPPSGEAPAGAQPAEGPIARTQHFEVRALGGASISEELATSVAAVAESALETIYRIWLDTEAAWTQPAELVFVPSGWRVTEEIPVDVNNPSYFNLGDDGRLRIYLLADPGAVIFADAIARELAGFVLEQELGDALAPWAFTGVSNYSMVLAGDGLGLFWSFEDLPEGRPPTMSSEWVMFQQSWPREENLAFTALSNSLAMFLIQETGPQDEDPAAGPRRFIAFLRRAHELAHEVMERMERAEPSLLPGAHHQEAIVRGFRVALHEIYGLGREDGEWAFEALDRRWIGDGVNEGIIEQHRLLPEVADKMARELIGEGSRKATSRTAVWRVMAWSTLVAAILFGGVAAFREQKAQYDEALARAPEPGVSTDIEGDIEEPDPEALAQAALERERRRDLLEQLVYGSANHPEMWSELVEQIDAYQGRSLTPGAGRGEPTELARALWDLTVAIDQGAISYDYAFRLLLDLEALALGAPGRGKIELLIPVVESMTDDGKEPIVLGSPSVILEGKELRDAIVHEILIPLGKLLLRKGYAPLPVHVFHHPPTDLETFENLVRERVDARGGSDSDYDELRNGELQPAVKFYERLEDDRRDNRRRERKRGVPLSHVALRRAPPSAPSESARVIPRAEEFPFGLNSRIKNALPGLADLTLFELAHRLDWKQDFVAHALQTRRLDGLILNDVLGESEPRIREAVREVLRSLDQIRLPHEAPKDLYPELDFNVPVLTTLGSEDSDLPAEVIEELLVVHFERKGIQGLLEQVILKLSLAREDGEGYVLDVFRPDTQFPKGNEELNELLDEAVRRLSERGIPVKRRAPVLAARRDWLPGHSFTPARLLRARLLALASLLTAAGALVLWFASPVADVARAAHLFAVAAGFLGAGIALYVSLREYLFLASISSPKVYLQALLRSRPFSDYEWDVSEKGPAEDPLSIVEARMIIADPISAAQNQSLKLATLDQAKTFQLQFPDYAFDLYSDGIQTAAGTQEFDRVRLVITRESGEGNSRQGSARVAEFKDYYADLGVSDTASQDKIKRAYHGLVLKFHPDRKPTDPEADRKFKDAANAYEVLNDPDSRAKYDKWWKLMAKKPGLGAVPPVEEPLWTPPFSLWSEDAAEYARGTYFGEFGNWEPGPTLNLHAQIMNRVGKSMIAIIRNVLRERGIRAGVFAFEPDGLSLGERLRNRELMQGWGELAGMSFGWWNDQKLPLRWDTLLWQVIGDLNLVWEAPYEFDRFGYSLRASFFPDLLSANTKPRRPSTLRLDLMAVTGVPSNYGRPYDPLRYRGLGSDPLAPLPTTWVAEVDVSSGDMNVIGPRLERALARAAEVVIANVAHAPSQEAHDRRRDADFPQGPVETFLDDLLRNVIDVSMRAGEYPYRRVDPMARERLLQQAASLPRGEALKARVGELIDLDLTFLELDRAIRSLKRDIAPLNDTLLPLGYQIRYRSTPSEQRFVLVRLEPDIHPAELLSAPQPPASTLQRLWKRVQRWRGRQQAARAARRAPAAVEAAPKAGQRTWKAMLQLPLFVMTCAFLSAAVFYASPPRGAISVPVVLKLAEGGQEGFDEIEQRERVYRFSRAGEETTMRTLLVSGRLERGGTRGGFYLEVDGAPAFPWGFLDRLVRSSPDLDVSVNNSASVKKLAIGEGAALEPPIEDDPGMDRSMSYSAPVHTSLLGRTFIPVEVEFQPNMHLREDAGEPFLVFQYPQVIVLARTRLGNAVVGAMIGLVLTALWWIPASVRFLRKWLQRLFQKDRSGVGPDHPSRENQREEPTPRRAPGVGADALAVRRAARRATATIGESPDLEPEQPQAPSASDVDWGHMVMESGYALSRLGPDGPWLHRKMRRILIRVAHSPSDAPDRELLESADWALRTFFARLRQRNRKEFTPRNASSVERFVARKLLLRMITADFGETEFRMMLVEDGRGAARTLDGFLNEEGRVRTDVVDAIVVDALRQATQKGADEVIKRWLRWLERRGAQGQAAQDQVRIWIQAAIEPVELMLARAFGNAGIPTRLFQKGAAGKTPAHRVGKLVRDGKAKGERLQALRGRVSLNREQFLDRLRQAVFQRKIHAGPHGELSRWTAGDIAEMEEGFQPVPMWLMDSAELLIRVDEGERLRRYLHEGGVSRDDVAKRHSLNLERLEILEQGVQGVPPALMTEVIAWEQANGRRRAPVTAIRRATATTVLERPRPRVRKQRPERRRSTVVQGIVAPAPFVPILAGPRLLALPAPPILKLLPAPPVSFRAVRDVEVAIAGRVRALESEELTSENVAWIQTWRPAQQVRDTLVFLQQFETEPAQVAPFIHLDQILRYLDQIAEYEAQVGSTAASGELRARFLRDLVGPVTSIAAGAPALGVLTPGGEQALSSVMRLDRMLARDALLGRQHPALQGHLMNGAIPGRQGLGFFGLAAEESLAPVVIFDDAGRRGVSNHARVPVMIFEEAKVRALGLTPSTFYRIAAHWALLAKQLEEALPGSAERDALERQIADFYQTFSLAPDEQGRVFIDERLAVHIARVIHEAARARQAVSRAA